MNWSCLRSTSACPSPASTIAREARDLHALCCLMRSCIGSRKFFSLPAKCIDSVTESPMRRETAPREEATMRRSPGLATAVAVSLVLLWAPRSDAKCDPAGADAADVAAAHAAVAANCDCAGAANHGQYVKCVTEQARATLGNPSCRGAVTKCAARSTCGKPGFVTCCRISAKGKLKCSTKSSADRCKPPKGGQACVGSTPSCCD